MAVVYSFCSYDEDATFTTKDEEKTLNSIKDMLENLILVIYKMLKCEKFGETSDFRTFKRARLELEQDIGLNMNNINVHKNLKI